MAFTTTSRRRVILESPYQGDQGALRVERNLRYLRACLHNSLSRGESPFASHGLYTQPGVLDDTISDQRGSGIDAGFAWRECAAATVVYTDFGITRGMQAGIAHASTIDHVVEFRELGHDAICDIMRSINEGADHLLASARWGWTNHDR